MRMTTKLALWAIAFMSTAVWVFAADMNISNQKDIDTYYSNIYNSKYLPDWKTLITSSQLTTANSNSYLDPQDAVKNDYQEVIDCNLVFANWTEKTKFEDYWKNDMPKAYEYLNTLSKDWRTNYCFFDKTKFNYVASFEDYKAENKKWNEYIIAWFALQPTDKYKALWLTEDKVATLWTVVWSQFKKVNIIEEVKPVETVTLVKPVEPTKPVVKQEPTKPKPQPIPEPKPTPKPEPIKVELVCKGWCNFDWMKDVTISWKLVKEKSKVCTTITKWSITDTKTWVKAYFSYNNKSLYTWLATTLKVNANYTLEEVKVDKAKYKDWTFKIKSLSY